MESMFQRITNLPLRIKLLIAIAIIALGCAVIWLIPSFAPCTATFTKDNSLVNEPSGSEVRIAVPSGSRGQVISKTRDQWVQVEYGDQRGWVFANESNFVSLNGACWSVPIIEIGE
jgi:hypothetical protein